MIDIVSLGGVTTVAGPCTAAQILQAGLDANLWHPSFKVGVYLPPYKPGTSLDAGTVVPDGTRVEIHRVP